MSGHIHVGSGDQPDYSFYHGAELAADSELSSVLSEAPFEYAEAYPLAGVSPAVVNVGLANPQVGVQAVNPNVLVTPLEITCYNVGTSGDDPTTFVREQSEFAKKHKADLTDKWMEVMTHMKGELALPLKDIISIYPMSGKVIWEDENGEIQETYLLTKGPGALPKCLVSLREIYAKDGEWKTHSWPQYSTHTKASDSGPAMLKRNTKRLEGRKCFASNLDAALKAARTPQPRIKMMGNLHRAQQFKTQMTAFYKNKAVEYDAKAAAAADNKIAAQHRETAKTLAKKADFMESGLDWDAIHTAILNPINCNAINLAGSADVLKIVEDAKALQEKHVAEIELDKGDQPKDCALNVLIGFIPKVSPIKDPKATTEEKVRAREEVLLSIEHEDLDTQRLLAREAYKSLGIRDEKEVPRDPLEFQLVLKMIAIVDRSVSPQDAVDRVSTGVLDNSSVDTVLCSGIHSVQLRAEVRAEVQRFAHDMQIVKDSLIGKVVLPNAQAVNTFNGLVASPMTALPTK